MRPSSSLSRGWPLVVPVVLGAALGWRNPVDTFVRSRWVQAMDAGAGEATATLCMSASTPAEAVEQRAELTERITALHAAGAAVVAIDLDLSTPHPTDEALRAAAGAGPTVFGRSMWTQPFSHEHRSGVTDMEHTWLVPMNVGAPLPTPGEAPLAFEALALLEGAGPPVASGDGWKVGSRTIPPDVAAMSFMPYRIPTLDWDDRSTWATAEGRAVFVGACALDRELTRYGDQPGAAAHGALLETARSGFFPRQANGGIDVALALATLGAGIGARRRFGRGGALAVGGAVVAGAMLVALTGTWLGLSGLVLAAVVAAVWKVPARMSEADAEVANALAAGRLSRLVGRDGEADEATLPPASPADVEERDELRMFVAPERREG